MFFKEVQEVLSRREAQLRHIKYCDEELPGSATFVSLSIAPMSVAGMM